MSWMLTSTRITPLTREEDEDTKDTGESVNKQSMSPNTIRAVTMIRFPPAAPRFLCVAFKWIPFQMSDFIQLLIQKHLLS